MVPRKRKQQVVPSDPRLDFSHNEDLIAEILSWLPAKSLLRFRRVCNKSWKDIISRPCFVNKHLSRAAVSRFQVLQCDGNDTKLDLKANKKPDLRRLFSTDIYSLTVGSTEILTVGSCNGLMCLQVSRKRGLYLIWNPCTGDTKMLPELTSISDYEFYGFGYDFANKDYKLIVGSESTSATGSCTTKVAVFTLKNCSWRTIECLEHVRLRGYGCSLDGSLHWLECKRDPEDRWKETYRVSENNLFRFRGGEISGGCVITHRFSAKLVRDF